MEVEHRGSDVCVDLHQRTLTVVYSVFDSEIGAEINKLLIPLPENVDSIGNTRSK